MQCLIPGEARREPTGKVRAADTPPRELFSLTHVILLIPEQILSTIYGKSAILQCRWPVGADLDSSPGSVVGALSSIFDPVFGVRTLQSQPPDLCAGGFLQPGVPFRASLYLHVVNSHTSFQIFVAKCFLGVLQVGKAHCVCVSVCVCVTAHNKRITEFILIFERFCYIFNPSGIHFNFGVGKKLNIIFVIASCPHTIITYQLIYSWICF